MSRYKRLPIAIALRTRRVPRSRLRLMQPQLQSELRPSGSGRLSIAAERGAFALLSRRRCRRRHHVRLRRSEEHTSELQSLRHLVCRLLPVKLSMMTFTNLRQTVRKFISARTRAYVGG